MSYYRDSDDILENLEHRLQHHCGYPFKVQNVEALRGIIAEHIRDERQREYMLASVTATVASALSAAFIRAGGDECFKVSEQRPKNWAQDAETALVVGFGGFLRPLIVEEGRVKNVHVIDWYYDRKSSGFREELVAWASQRPEKCVTGSTQLQSTADLQKFDLLSITGSTLCNGSLEYFLTNIRKDAIVILQGQSASLHPKILFEAGVKWIATTLKPPALGRMARGSHDGEAMRPPLQGGLPWIYLLPR